jgi:hypothetical protein
LEIIIAVAIVIGVVLFIRKQWAKIKE